MKKLVLLSIVLNVALVVAVIAGLKKGGSISTVSATTPALQNEEKNSPPSETTTASKTNETGFTAPFGIPRFNWREVESPDYKEYIAKLRAIHCPEETIIDIIVADVNKFYRSKLAPYRKQPDNKFKYWTNDNWYSRPRDTEYEKMARDNEKEKRKLLKELLGIDYQKEMAKQNGWPQREDEFQKNLSDETKEKMGEISEKFQEMTSEIHRKARGYHDEDVQKDLKQVEKAKMAELAKIFTPEQLEEYQMRHSSLAQNMRYNELEGFDASEAEYRAIVKAKLAAEDLPETNEAGAKLSREEKAKLAKENEASLKEVLGEDRYKEYELNQNYEYRSLVKIAEKVGVDKTVAARVYEMKDEAEKAKNAVSLDKNLTSDQRKEKLQAIRTAAEAEVAQQLGERGSKAYIRNNGWWIRNLSPKQ